MTRDVTAYAVARAAGFARRWNHSRLHYFTAVNCLWLDAIFEWIISRAISRDVLFMGSPFSGNPFPALRWPWLYFLLLFLHHAIQVWHVKPFSFDTSLSLVRLLRGAARSLVFVSTSRWFAISRPVSCRPTPCIAPNLSETFAEIIMRLTTPLTNFRRHSNLEFFLPMNSVYRALLDALCVPRPVGASAVIPRLSALAKE